MEIKKVFEYKTRETWTKANRGKAVMILNTNEETIEIAKLTGADMKYETAILFAMQDHDVRQMIHQYQQGGRSRDFAIRMTSGVSGRLDFYINYYSRGIQINGKHLLHVTCYGKIEGLKRMYIGDFVELAAYIDSLEAFQGIDWDNRVKLLRLSRAKYAKAYVNEDADKEVSKLIIRK